MALVSPPIYPAFRAYFLLLYPSTLLEMFEIDKSISVHVLKLYKPVSDCIICHESNC
jgi:hypothetical protein